MQSIPQCDDAADQRLNQWLARLKTIDRLIQFSVPTLIRVARWSLDERQASVPLFITDRDMATSRFYLLVHAIYSSTVQRVAGAQRRLDWLTKEERKDLRRLSHDLSQKLLPKRRVKRNSLRFLRYADSDLFGALNPLTSSEIFWSFIRAGEKAAHSGVGFLTFFGMLWSLGRRFPDSTEAGASLEPSGPSTTLTAKCLLAIRTLCETLRQRGNLYERVADLVSSANRMSGKRGPNATWKFAFELDRLAGKLFELSPYTLNGVAFVKAGDELLRLSRDLGPDSPSETQWTAAREVLRGVLRNLDREQKKVFADAAAVVVKLFPEIIKCLEPKGLHDDLRQYCRRLAPDSAPRAYWMDHARAARRARDLCRRSLSRLQKPFASFGRLKGKNTPATARITGLFRALAKSNLDVAADIDRFVSDSVQWCRRAINEESARASAGNLTDFDPAGLISAIAVAQKWDLISTPEAEDAIHQVLKGALQDGSWSRAQPIYLAERILGVWPHTPDIVWMLAVALNAQSTITIADDKLFAFVDWLDRTKTQFHWPNGGFQVQGWSSELDRLTRIIDFWNTCVSINALLEIRELVEKRLWQMCTERFTVLRTTRTLDEVAPVDLGAIHEKRLHRRLITAARLSELERSQVYGIVLHGPPGSSKTAIVEGWGSEMWKGVRAEPRIIRITPSDFTRQGEERLDYEARFIFDLVSHVRGVTILFDEIDDFLRQRIAEENTTFIKLITPSMLNRLQDLRDAAPRQEICFVIATNFVDKIEPALLRPGRIDAIIPVAYPDAWSREAILEKNLGRAFLPRKHVDEIIRHTIAWPWSTYNKLTSEIAKHAKEGPVTEKRVAALVASYREQVPSSDYYYHDAKRWAKQSPLANEYVHLAFCTAREIAKCRDSLGKVKEYLPEGTWDDMLETFDAQVKAERRQ